MWNLKFVEIYKCNLKFVDIPMNEFKAFYPVVGKKLIFDIL